MGPGTLQRLSLGLSRAACQIVTVNVVGGGYCLSAKERVRVSACECVRMRVSVCVCGEWRPHRMCVGERECERARKSEREREIGEGVAFMQCVRKR